LKSLIIFTVSYPYGAKEQFLEAELLYLSECFEKITIIPTYISKETRKIPKNVSVDSEYALKHTNLSFFIQSFTSKYFYIEVIDTPSILLSLNKLIKLISFVGKGKSLYKYLIKYYDSQAIFYSYWFNGSVFGSYLYNQEKSINFCTRVHGSDLYLEINEGYLPLRQRILKKINKIFCISNDGAIYLQKNYIIDSAKVVISKLGTRDQNIYTQGSKDESVFRLVSCSHLIPLKRVDMLVQILVLVAQRNPNITIEWTHLGGGFLYNELKDTCKSLNTSNLKCNLTGAVSNLEVFKYFKTHEVDLFINVSSSEGLPVSFMEAFSCSIPILSIDNGGISEIVNQQNGVLLAKDSVIEDIVHSLTLCINDRTNLHKKKMMAKGTWQKSYNAKTNYTRFCKVLHDNN